VHDDLCLGKLKCAIFTKAVVDLGCIINENILKTKGAKWLETFSKILNKFGLNFKQKSFSNGLHSSCKKCNETNKKTKSEGKTENAFWRGKVSV